MLPTVSERTNQKGGKLLMRTRAAWGYGATVACLTPDQKVGSVNLSAFTLLGALRDVTRVVEDIWSGSGAKPVEPCD